MVQVIVALVVETLVETFEITGADGGACTASVVKVSAGLYAVSPEEVLDIAR